MSFNSSPSNISGIASDSWGMLYAQGEQTVSAIKSEAVSLGHDALEQGKETFKSVCRRVLGGIAIGAVAGNVGFGTAALIAGGSVLAGGLTAGIGTAVGAAVGAGVGAMLAKRKGVKDVKKFTQDKIVGRGIGLAQQQTEVWANFGRQQVDTLVSAGARKSSLGRFAAKLAEHLKPRDRQGESQPAEPDHIDPYDDEIAALYESYF